MASLALGIVGAVAGSFFGQPALGFMIGSALGGLFERQNQPDINSVYEAPRLSDLKVQSSTYGAPIPIVYGSMRLAGNIIWSTGLIETRHEETTTQEQEGGKGGGGGGEVSQTTITYTYAASFAVGLCEGVIAGVRRIWADGKLIYDVGANADAMTIYVSNSQQSAARVYTGTTTQNPDPLIESYLGVGNVPGYRGLAYLVFDNLQLQDFGNRIPNIEVEVLKAATDSGARVLSSIPDTGIQYAYSTGGGFPTYVPGVGVPIATAFDGTFRVTGWYQSNFFTTATDLDTVWVFDSNGNFIGTDSRQQNEKFPHWYFDLHFLQSYTIAIGLIKGYQMYQRYKGKAVGDGYTLLPLVLPGDLVTEFLADAADCLPTGEIVGGVTISADNTKAMVFTAPNGSNLASNTVNKWYILKFNGALASIESSGSIAVPFSGNLFTGRTGFDSFNCSCMENDYKTVWRVGAASNNASIYQVIDGVLTLVTLLSGVWTAAGGGGFFYPTCIADKGVCWAVGDNKAIVLTRLPNYTRNSVSLSSVINDLVGRSNITTNDINVTALASDQLTGYVISKPMTIRTAIEPLQKAFFFDATESDNLIKFVKRGGSTALTIPQDDLAAHQASEDLPDLLTTMRAQELELPRRVTLTFYNQDGDYQNSEQYAARLVTESVDIANEELAIAMTNQQAAQIASVLLYNEWQARNIREFQTSLKYAYIDPCDIVNIETDEGLFTVRILQTDYGQNGVVKFKAADENAAVYNPSATGVDGGAIGQTLSLPGATRLALLDIPILRDVDDNAGFYWAACGFLTAWRGTSLFISNDGGITWTNTSSSIIGATIGAASDILGNWTGGNNFDYGNSVTVTLVNGALSSTTIDSLLNNANAALIGNEIIQFLNAELVGTNQYKLSYLLRGRRGTEWAINTHVVGDRFILLDPSSVQRVIANQSQINVAASYKAVSLGNTLSITNPNDFTNTGVGLKPFSPVNIAGGRDASGNIYISWLRRTRIGGGWLDNVDAPLGEASESYSVDIMNGSAVVRTVATSTPAITYTAAQQVTDFGGLQSSVTIKVYQLSAVVGRGYPGNATI
jgi:hypothetical protein